MILSRLIWRHTWFPEQIIWGGLTDRPSIYVDVDDSMRPGLTKRAVGLFNSSVRTCIYSGSANGGKEPRGIRGYSITGGNTTFSSWKLQGNQVPYRVMNIRKRVANLTWARAERQMRLIHCADISTREAYTRKGLVLICQDFQIPLGLVLIPPQMGSLVLESTSIGLLLIWWKSNCLSQET